MSTRTRPLYRIDFYEFPYVFGQGWAGLVWDHLRIVGLTPGSELDWRGIYWNSKVISDLLQMIISGEAKLLRTIDVRHP